MTIKYHPLQAETGCLNDLFETVFKQFGDTIAFSQNGGSITYAELNQKSKKMAGWFQHKSGLKPGDRVALQLPNLMQSPLFMIAILRAGLVLVNVNPSFTPTELNFLLKDSGAKALITFAPLARKASLAMKDTEIETVILTELGDLHAKIKGSLINQYIRHISMPFSKEAIPNAYWLRDLLTDKHTPKWQPLSQSPHDLALLQYTGGTTGTPKGAMLSHYNLMANFSQLKQLLDIYTETGQERLYQPLPLYHIYAFMLTLSLFSQGAHTRLITDPRDPSALVKNFKVFKPTVCAGIDPLFHSLLKQKTFHRLPFHSLKLTISGGMALSTPLAKEWQKITSCPITEGYGLTECSPVVSVNRPDNIQLGTAGELLNMTRIRIIDDEGQALPEGEIGEIQVLGPQVMMGYWNQPDETRRVINEEGWLSTGDIGLISADGKLKILDRKKELICVSGFKIFPSEIERLVCSIPGVEDCAAVGIPDPLTGERIKLFVVTRSTSVTPEIVRNYCKERLTGYKVPNCIEFCSALPRSPVGKVQRGKLKDLALRLSQGTQRHST
ncbi:AMP-binding protein [Nitrincola schmidtii]|uniref:AMP-binding protein n=1 Tax=Nitrincola schmidtii TaxID=1730894 RepID=UPI00124C5E78|nr:AMP-binding protein [Nitrincola schmidtii]